MIPIIQVSRLSSASSFYASITQPLGIRYLSLPALPAASSDFSPSSPPPATVTFGSDDCRKPLFQIRQVTPTRDRPLNTCSLAFSASSPDAVHKFHAAALRAFPHTSAVIGPCDSILNSSSGSATVVGVPVSPSPDSGDICARVTDFDGNIMAVAYRPSYSYPSHHGGSSLSRRHQLADADPSRSISYSYAPPSGETAPYLGNISGSSSSRYRDMTGDLDYNYYYGSGTPSSSARYHQGSGSNRSSLRRSATATAPAAAAYEPARPSPREHSKGTSAGGMAMLGVAAVGAAAGAALTYSMIRGTDRSTRAPSRSRDFEPPMVVPAFQRRSTFPDPGPPPPYTSSRYSSYEGMRKKTREDSKMDDPYDDGYSRHSSSSRRYRSGSSSRARSEDPLGRVPLMLPEAELRHSSSGGSYSGSRRSSTAVPHAPPLVSHRSAPAPYEDEHESFVSARSHRTVRPHGGNSSRLLSIPPSASRSASVRQGGGGGGRAENYMAARRVPLPASGVGSSHARWDDEYPRYEYDEEEDDDDPILVDDNDSIAPSDSISCVGSRGRHGRYY